MCYCGRVESPLLLLWPFAAGSAPSQVPYSYKVLGASLPAALSPPPVVRTPLQHSLHLSWAGAPHWVTSRRTRSPDAHTHTGTASCGSLSRVRRSGFSSGIPSAFSPGNARCSSRLSGHSERRTTVLLIGDAAGSPDQDPPSHSWTGDLSWTCPFIRIYRFFSASVIWGSERSWGLLWTCLLSAVSMRLRLWSGLYLQRLQVRTTDCCHGVSGLTPDCAQRARGRFGQALLWVCHCTIQVTGGVLHLFSLRHGVHSGEQVHLGRTGRNAENRSRLFGMHNVL